MNTEQLQPTTLIPNNRMVMTRWWGGGCPCTLRNLHNMRLFGIDLVGSSCSQYEYELQIQTNVQVVSWLSMHNFPHGLVSFADGFNVDPLRFLNYYQDFNTLKVAAFITITSTVNLWQYIQNCLAANLFRHKTEFLRGLQQDHQVRCCKRLIHNHNQFVMFLMLMSICIYTSLGRSSCWVWLQQGHFSLFQVGQIMVEKSMINFFSVGTLSNNI